MRFSRDGKGLFSCGGDGNLVLAKIIPSSISNDGSLIKQDVINRTRNVLLSNGLSYDVVGDASNKYVVCAGQNAPNLHIYSVASGKHVRSYSTDPSEYLDSNDGMEGGELKEHRPRGGSEVYKMDLCPAGMYLATCSFDRWIRLIDFYSGRVLAQVFAFFLSHQRRCSMFTFFNIRCLDMPSL